MAINSRMTRRAYEYRPSTGECIKCAASKSTACLHTVFLRTLFYKRSRNCATENITRVSIGCPTTYQTRHFFNNSKTNEDIATKQTHTTDTFLFISHTTNVLLFKFRCNILIAFRIIKEMPGSAASGTPCINLYSPRATGLVQPFKVGMGRTHPSRCVAAI